MTAKREIKARRLELIEEMADSTPPASAPARHSHLEEIILQMDALLRQLLDLASEGEIASTEKDAILKAAQEAYITRRLRDEIFGGRLFADPSWDILLDLFIASHEGENVSVSSACIAASVPSTTALRHIAHLVDIGLVLRRPHPRDSRSTYLELSKEGAAKMNAFFKELISAPDGPVS